jgi:tetratricopeptide (TPR) repeat protein
MSRARAGAIETSLPELMLHKATLARTAGLRAKYAQRGLSHDGAVDRTTRSMLLRQLYLSQMEAKRFSDALHTAEQMVALDVMPDVARQDAARACLGVGEVDQAVEHLRIAGRVSPASRRAFHLWTLGSVLYLSGRFHDSIGALSRAARWGTNDKPMYLAQLALARRAAGDATEDLGPLRERLADAPCGQGYGQFVLGELAFVEGDFEVAREYLAAFVERATGGRVALAVALGAEVARARRLLARMRPRRARAR